VLARHRLWASVQRRLLAAYCSVAEGGWRACRTRLLYAAASDAGALPEDVLCARIEREANSAARFREDAKGLHTLAAFHEWMMTTHLCYAVPRQEELFRPDNTTGRVLASY